VSQEECARLREGVPYVKVYRYITRLVSKEIFSPSNKIHREVGRAKDLSAPRYIKDNPTYAREHAALNADGTVRFSFNANTDM
jgi:hypothetical protein